MLQEAVQWFGDTTPNMVVQVVPPSLNITVDQPSVTMDTPVDITITTRDAESMQLVAGKVLVDGSIIGDTNTLIRQYTFRGRAVRLPNGTFTETPPSVTVSAGGYASTTVKINFVSML